MGMFAIQLMPVRYTEKGHSAAGQDTLVGGVSNQNWVEMLSFAEQARLQAKHFRALGFRKCGMSMFMVNTCIPYTGSYFHKYEISEYIG